MTNKTKYLIACVTAVVVVLIGLIFGFVSSNSSTKANNSQMSKTSQNAKESAGAQSAKNAVRKTDASKDPAIVPNESSSASSGSNQNGESPEVTKSGYENASKVGEYRDTHSTKTGAIVINPYTYKSQDGVKIKGGGVTVEKSDIDSARDTLNKNGITADYMSDADIAKLIDQASHSSLDIVSQWNVTYGKK